MTLLVIGLILFLGIHSIRVVAPGIRDAGIAAIGTGGWRGVYSLISLGGLVLLVWGFGQARATTGMLYTPPAFFSHITLTLMILAMISLAASQMPAGHIKTRAKHPMVLSVKIWAFAHLLANGETSSVILFGAFLAWGVIMRIAYKRRERAGLSALPVYKSWTWDIAAIAVGLVLYAAFVFKLHEWLIGVAPVMV